MDTLSELCMEARLTPDAFQSLVGISRRTFYRWQDNPPAWTRVLCRLLGGKLDTVHPEWERWSISCRGELCSPENETFTPGELRSWHWRYQQIRALKCRVKELEEQLEKQNAIDDQPTPGEIRDVKTIQLI